MAQEDVRAMANTHMDMNELRAALDELWPVAKGSPSRVRKPCIRSSCKACASATKHPVWLFSFRQTGRRVCMYVPERLVPTLHSAPSTTVGNLRRWQSMPVRPSSGNEGARRRLRGGAGGCWTLPAVAGVLL